MIHKITIKYTHTSDRFFRSIYLLILDTEIFNLISISMNKKVYYRGTQSKVNSFIKQRKGHKMSMDDLTPLFSRPPSENKKRNSNDHYYEPSKLQRSTFKKNKMSAAISMANSVTATKTNSPLKFRMRNSQPKYSQKEK